jgi:hypothetical protein
MGFTIALETGVKDVHSGTDRRPGAQPDRRARRADRGVLRRAHRQVKIPGFYDDVRKLSAPSARRSRARGSRASGSRTRTSSRSLRPSKRRLAGLIALTAAPTLEVHGIVGGYSGPGIKTIVPHRAEAKLSTRLVPDQKPPRCSSSSSASSRRACPTRWSRTRRRWSRTSRRWGAHKRRRGGGDARDVRQAAGVRARRRVDRRRADRCASC